MATIRSTRRPQRTRHSSATTFVTSIIVLVIGGGLVVYFSSTRDGDNLTGGARQHRGDGRRRLPFAGLYARKPGLPPRVQDLIRKKQVVGDRIADIKSGKVTVEEVLHTFIDDTDNGNSPKIPLNDHKDNVIAVENGLDGDNAGVIAMDAFDVPPLASAKVADAPPMTLREISDTIMLFLHQLHQVCANNKRAFFWEIWQAYHDLAVKTLYPWDREYLRRMPERRTDDSIFLSLASYRDENCLNTIKGAYMMAKHPEKLFVGLVQQNCLTNCRSGVMKSLRMEVSSSNK